MLKTKTKTLNLGRLWFILGPSLDDPFNLSWFEVLPEVGNLTSGQCFEYQIR